MRTFRDRSTFVWPLLLLLLTGLIAGASPSTPVAAAEAEVAVMIDGKKLSLDVPPVIVGGRTLVPLRAIFEALGADVTWIGEKQTVVAVRGRTNISLPVGETAALINGTPNKLDVPAQIVAGRTLVPVRFVSESLGALVDWDNTTRTVTIVSPPVALSFPEAPTLPSADPEVWSRTDRAYLEQFKAELEGNPAKVDTLREELGRLLLAIKAAKDRDGLSSPRAFRVYPPETAVRLRAMELAALARSRLLASFQDPGKRTALSVDYPDFWREDDYILSRPAGNESLDPLPVFRSLDGLKVPEHLLKEYEVYLLPYVISKGSLRVNGFGSDHRAIIGRTTAVQPDGELRSLAGTAAHEFGHHLDQSYLGDYSENRTLWDRYMRIKNIHSFQDSSSSAQDWKNSVREALAEDFRILFGNETASADEQQTAFSDPRKVPGQTDALKALFSDIWSGPARLTPFPVRHAPVSVRISNQPYLVTDFPYLPIETTPSSDEIRLVLKKGGQIKSVLISPASPGRPFKTSLPLLDGPGLYELYVGYPKSDGSTNYETFTVLAVNPLPFRELAPAGPKIEPNRKVYRAAEASAWADSPVLSGSTHLSLRHHDGKHRLEMAVPTGASRPDSIKLPLTMGDGVYELVSQGTDGSAVILGHFLLDTPTDPWTPPASKVAERASPVARVAGSGFIFRGASEKTTAAYQVLDSQSKVVAQGPMTRTPSGVFEAGVGALPGPGLYQLQFLEPGDLNGAWLYRETTIIIIE